MAIYVSNLIIEKGSNFSQIFDVFGNTSQALDLSGYTAESHIRKNSSSSLYTPFSISFVDSVNGKIKLSIGSTYTSNFKSGRYVYDVLVTTPENKKNILIEGTILVKTGISTNCL